MTTAYRTWSDLRVVIDELCDRYAAVLPGETVAEVVHAVGRELAGQRPAGDADDAGLVGRVADAARVELALAVGMPVDRPACDLLTTGRASAWTHLLGVTAVVRVIGDLDLQIQRMLRNELDRAQAFGRDITMVDLGRVSFMDLAGLAPLVAAARTARQVGRQLVLMQVPASVQRLIELAGVRGEFAADWAGGLTQPA
jgi:anti-anti-sigma factor